MEIGLGESSQTAKLIWLIGTPVVFVVGLIGNGITLAVFLGPKNKGSSTAVYFIWLALADSMVLLVELPRWWIIYAGNYDIRHYSDLVCKIHMLGIVYSATLSSYVLVAVTIERLISTVKPHKVKIICTPKIANIVCGVFVAIIIVFSFPTMYGYGITHLGPSDNTIGDDNSSAGTTALSKASTEIDAVTMSSTNEATNQPDIQTGGDVGAFCSWYRGGQYDVFQLIDRFVQFFIGFLFVEVTFVIADAIIIYNLARAGMQRTSGVSKHVRQITITLVTINLVFIVSKTPLYVFLSFVNTYEDNSASDAKEVAWAIICFFFFSNHAVNFFLYVMIGERFRRQVIELLTGRCRRKDDKRMSIKSITDKSTTKYEVS